LTFLEGCELSFGLATLRGTFTLTFGGYTTAGIAYNATAAVVQTALEALTSFGTGNVTVTGSNGGPYTVTFVGSLGLAAQSTMTASAAGLTGGTPSIAVASTTSGVAPDATWTIKAGAAETWRTSSIVTNPMPGNVRWATTKEQANNKTTNILYTIDGVTKTMAEWCDEYGMDWDLVWSRVKAHGYDIVRALTEPKRGSMQFFGEKGERVGYRQYLFKGKVQNLKQWADEYKVSHGALQQKMRKGWHMEGALLGAKDE
jgi:hypothetical protein